MAQRPPQNAGYMRSTKAMEYHFANAEQDAVRHAFLPTSFVQIRRLPAKMKAGTLGQGGVVMSDTSPSRYSGGRDWAGSAPTWAGMQRQRSAFSGEAARSSTSVGGTLSPRRFSAGPKMF